MPLFMDIHKGMEGVTKDGLEEAHKLDLEVQARHGVKFLNYWYNEDEGTVMCLCEAPNKEAANAVHKEAHGNMADELFEVKSGS